MMIGQRTPILTALDDSIILLKTDEQALSALHLLVILSAVD
ncbi:hypothetical protein [Haladaptatus pallidirubidus]|nr:hypothetical protein [Haladaptatus pallidirubidus]